ncbi:PKD domain-containing protein [Actinoplanes sp. NPDC049265]|uniref:PKD domain-containing protein n=1 Tax=Actinoplanes sp. NPDC049265 TaxID=3363902 RepID=UPI00371E7D85
MATTAKRPVTRRVAAAGAAAAITAGLIAGIVAGADDGYSAEVPRLMSGAAWLPSARTGELALIDGINAEVAARVGVTPPGHGFDVVQHDADAYIVDAVDGTVRRVDGATMTAVPPLGHDEPGATVIPGASAGVRVFAADDVLYALDTVHGLLAEVDPETLAAQRAPRPLAAATEPGTAVMDSAGALWTLDARTGNLSIVSGDRSVVRRDAVTAGAGRLLLAGDEPVLIDLATSDAYALDPDDGTRTATVRLELGNARDPAIGASPRSARVYPTYRGMVSVCEISGPGCDRAIALTDAGNRLGTPVESGGRLFVPELTHGRVFIVDLGTNTVVARPTVLRPPADFQLVARDGLVFFNDPASQRAGLIRANGDVVAVPKYDRTKPSTGTPGEVPSSLAGTSPSAPPPSTTPSEQPGSDSSAAPSSTPSAPSAPLSGEPSGGAESSPDPSGPPSGPSALPSVVRPEITLKLSAQTAMTDQKIDFELVVTAGKTQPDSVAWDFGDTTTTQGPKVTHAWTVEGKYTVKVTATFPGGDVLDAKQSIDVTNRPALTVQTPVGGKITGPGIDCGSDCGEPYDEAAPARSLTATPAAGFALTGWVGDCAGTDPVCTVDTTVNRTVGATFKRVVMPLIPMATQAVWRTSAGEPSSGGEDFDQNSNTQKTAAGFALVHRPGSWVLEDHTAPEYLETHPAWQQDGWINGDFALPSPVVPGDRFRSRIGFIELDPRSGVSAGEADFVVSAVQADGTATELYRIHDKASDTILYDLDVDLAPAQGPTGLGATAIRIRAEAAGASTQDWCAWINPRVEG